MSDNEKAALYPVDAQEARKGGVLTGTEINEGMDEMSEKFKELGGQIYLKAGE